MSALAAWARRLSKGWRQALRMTTAALLAYAATGLLHLHQGQWAVITCLVVVQGRFANTLDASLTRIYGTLAGAAVGAVGILVLARSGLPGAAILGLAVAPTAALAAIDPRFRLAPVTAGLVVLAASAGNGGVTVALDRVGEILLGGVIGVACTLLVLPERAETALIRGSADVLDILGRVARAHFDGHDIEQLHLDLEAAFVKTQAAAAEVTREQRVRLDRGPPTRPFMTALRRLRTDVALIERTLLSETGGAGHAAEADAIVAWFADAASALRNHAPPRAPPPAANEALGEGARDFAALGFVAAALQREQANFCARAADRLA